MLYGNIHTWPSQAVIECLVMENTVITSRKSFVQHTNITFYKSTYRQNSVTGKTPPDTYYGLEKKKHHLLVHIECLMREVECRVRTLK